jgi:hypothetical protein
MLERSGGQAMTEAEWLACGSVWNLMKVVKLNNDDRKARLWACAACRTVWNFLTDERSRIALGNLEIYADDFAQEKLRRDAFNLSQEAIDMSWFPAPGSAAARAVHWAADPGWRPHLYRDVVRVLSNEGGLDEAAANWLLCDLFRDIFGNPFRPVSFSPSWQTDTAVALARQMYDSRDFGAMPILADALQDAGCDSDDILAHCRDPKQVHVRGCWVVDLVLGKE